MTVDELVQDGTRRMDQAVEHARNEFNTVRTGRASAALLDRDGEPGLGRTVRGLKVTAADLPDYVERVVRRYAAGRDPGEAFAAWAHRAEEEDLT